MLKRLIWVVVATVLFLFQINIGTADAVQIKESARTIPLNPEGDTIVLSNKDVQRGAKLFGSTCAKCHIQGKTKTNPNVGLSLKELANAQPPRDNLMALVEYIKNPRTYDGEEDISLLHPNTGRTDIFPELKGLTEDDVKSLAGHLLTQPNIDPLWGMRSLIAP
jgi:photosystem II cytochrome c550